MDFKGTRERTHLEGCLGNPTGSDNNKNREKWTKLKCILEAKLTGLTGVLEAKNKEKPRMTPGVRTRVFGL